MVCFTSAAIAIQFNPPKKGDFKEISLYFAGTLQVDLIFPASLHWIGKHCYRQIPLVTFFPLVVFVEKGGGREDPLRGSRSSQISDLVLYQCSNQTLNGILFLRWIILIKLRTTRMLLVTCWQRVAACLYSIYLPTCSPPKGALLQLSLLLVLAAPCNPGLKDAFQREADWITLPL